MNPDRKAKFKQKRSALKTIRKRVMVQISFENGPAVSVEVHQTNYKVWRELQL